MVRVYAPERRTIATPTGLISNRTHGDRRAPPKATVAWSTPNSSQPTDRSTMSDLTGKTKQKTGEITGDDDLKREGQADQAVANVKDGIDKIADKAKNLLKKDEKGPS